MDVFKLFTAHPESLGESYSEHLGTATYFGARMVIAGIACMLHGLLPFLFARTGSRAITELNEQMIEVIRFSNREAIPLVAGFDWAYDLDAIRYDPVRAEEIGYVTHPYANKRTRPWEPKWDEDFGFAAERYPVIATEIGFGIKPGQVVDDDHYGNRITRYLEQRGISWMAWVYDPNWGPPMLSSFDGYRLTGAGEFFRQAMQRAAAGGQGGPWRTE